MRSGRGLVGSTIMIGFGFGFSVPSWTAPAGGFTFGLASAGEVGLGFTAVGLSLMEAVDLSWAKLSELKPRKEAAINAAITFFIMVFLWWMFCENLFISKASLAPISILFVIS